MPRVRTAFNYDKALVSEETATINLDPSLARQEFKEECDINVIVKQFGIGYEIPDNFRLPQYGDFTGLDDYHSACNAIAEANEQFELLPATIRERFRNDPGDFVDFALDQNNQQELVNMGILKAPPPAPVLDTKTTAPAVDSVPD